MTEIAVYGYSDDLIEVEGAVREEFPWPSGEPAVLAFSDGTVLRIIYDDEGVWRISPLVRGSGEYSLTQGVDEDSDYSDRATLRGDITWVVVGKNWARSL